MKYETDTIFVNSENSKNSHPHGLLLNLTNKIDLRRGEQSVALQNCSICYTWKNILKLKAIDLKYLLEHG